MNNEEFLEGVLRTESGANYIANVDIRLLHSIFGISTETGEMLDAIKKVAFYGAEFDRVNMVEEFGDLMYYVALGLDALDITLEEVMQLNNSKLKARYPDKFTTERALNRNLEAERNILEGHNEPHS